MYEENEFLDNYDEINERYSDTAYDPYAGFEFEDDENN